MIYKVNAELVDAAYQNDAITKFHITFTGSVVLTHSEGVIVFTPKTWKNVELSLIDATPVNPKVKLEVDGSTRYAFEEVKVVESSIQGIDGEEGAPEAIHFFNPLHYKTFSITTL